VSLGVHALLLVCLALMGYQVQHESVRAFESPAVDTQLGAADSTFQDLDQGDEPPSQTPMAGSFAPNLGTVTVAVPTSAGGVPVPTDLGASPALEPMLASMDVRRATEAVLPSAMMFGQTVSIQGNGAEHVGEVEGAVDRIAVEIVRHLERDRTLVIWAFDASGSLLVERQRLAEHIGSIYTHIRQLDQNQLAADSGLMTLVVAFGQNRDTITPQPTDDVSRIQAAIRDVPLDESGIETTFSTVAEAVRRWGRYKDDQGRSYRPMIIVVTDEVGDDEARLEEAVDVATRAKTPVYVLGSQAVFGRSEGHVDYTDPKTKFVFRGIPVRQGPESALIEQIRLPFWYEGPQFEEIESGFGPYALSRLASATGGIYFVARMGPRRMGFDPARMREYRPDWIRRDRYEEAVRRSPLRQAVLNAAQITQQQLPGMPSLDFPPADSPEFKEAMARNQGIAERTAYTVEEALTPINAAAKLRDRETSRRWQAHYDLIRGRLLAMKVRCYEYNWACARMKRDMPKFSRPNSNAWQLVPDSTIQYSEKAAAAAEEARNLLERVVQDHPDTPWALLARRELKDAFGFKWVEHYVAPRPPDNGDSPAARRRAMNPNAAKPPPPPKL
jgi:hypothetical protein